MPLWHIRESARDRPFSELTRAYLFGKLLNFILYRNGDATAGTKFYSAPHLKRRIEASLQLLFSYDSQNILKYTYTAITWINKLRYVPYAIDFFLLRTSPIMLQAPFKLIRDVSRLTRVRGQHATVLAMFRLYLIIFKTLS